MITHFRAPFSLKTGPSGPTGPEGQQRKENQGLLLDRFERATLQQPVHSWDNNGSRPRFVAPGVETAPRPFGVVPRAT
jgi:hypothetical protein